MSKEEKQITQKDIGFNFYISIETEKRTATEAKYPDKTLTKASIHGNTDTLEEAIAQLAKATEEVKKHAGEK